MNLPIMQDLNYSIQYQICSVALTQNIPTQQFWACFFFNAMAPSAGHQNTGPKTLLCIL